MPIRPVARLTVLCLAPLTLAACGSDEPAEQAAASAEGMSTDEIAAEMKQGVRPQPGQYRSNAELVSLEIPGMPAAQVDQLKSMMAGAMAQANTYCLTPEDAEQGFEKMATEAQENCKVEKFDVDGGKFSGRFVCSGDDASGTMTMDGSGTETSSQMNMAMDMSSGSIPGGKMMMKMRASSERIGECEG
ncbi:DUF3617 domain-containing protein [Croceicoccus naphthovorans]|uniref:Uncharacterized protein n=1 Tax=Croceicoccus naphthovorans TaxID=1348774 RepID=A0A0G3XDS2_9SPHN|nr:DUF3617 domain-containing protein [Croceicoccus naphthovorans]AKM09347.1 hypothetical protein AB433_04085 [Croceicoccus naphthovorans]MBB3990261.1 hypothetical protein [Croceicoccus naphthovorans]